MKFDINRELLDHEDYLTTGITVLDQEKICGIPRGSTIAVVADPMTFSEVFLNHLAYTGRKTRYISTSRYSKHIEEDIVNLHRDAEEVPDNFICSDAAKKNESTMSLVKKELGRLEDDYRKEEEPQNFIVNSMNELKRQARKTSDSNSSYKTEVRKLYNTIKNSESLCYLHFIYDDISSFSELDKEILNIVDGIFRIEADSSSSNHIQKLVVPKLRGKTSLEEEKINMMLSQNKINIDTTQQLG